MNLREIRRSKGITQKQIAEYLGIDGSIISKYEKGICIPPSDKMLKMAEFLNVSVEELLGRTKQAFRPIESKSIENSFDSSDDMFIGCTHFGDNDIRIYENRPFCTVEEMDEEYIKRWNQAVKPGQTVYHLGDFGAEGCERKYVSRLNGNIRLVRGNHEKETNEYYRGQGFVEVYDMPVLYKDFWILSHAPRYTNINMPYAVIFSHVHNDPAYRDYSSHHFCVSADRLAGIPISFTQIRQIVTEQKAARINEEEQHLKTLHAAQ